MRHATLYLKEIKFAGAPPQGRQVPTLRLQPPLRQMASRPTQTRKEAHQNPNRQRQSRQTYGALQLAAYHCLFSGAKLKKLGLRMHGDIPAAYIDDSKDATEEKFVNCRCCVRAVLCAQTLPD